MSRARAAALALALALLVLAPGGIRAQEAARTTLARAPGGRPLAVVHIPADSAVAAALVATARSWIPAPVAALGLPPDTFAIVVAPTEAAFVEWTGGHVPDWGLAVAFPSERRIVMRSPRLTGTMDVDPAVVLRHELAHLYLHEAAGVGAGTVPRWFNEGFAALYAREGRWVDPYRLAWARMTGGLPPLESLERAFPSAAPEVAYLQSLAAVRNLRERGGDPAMAGLLARLRAGRGFDGALRETYGVTLAGFYDRWEADLSREYGWGVALSDERVLWSALALVVAGVWAWRRARFRKTIAARRAAEDAALGSPDDHALGVEEQDRYWEWEDDAWRGQEDDDRL